MMRVKVVLVSMLGLYGQLVNAGECLSQEVKSEIKDCLEEGLSKADRSLNEQLSLLNGVVSGAQKKALRLEQLEWLARRDDMCQIEPAISKDPDWIAKLSQQFPKAECAIYLSNSRVNELRNRLEKERKRTDKELADFPVVANTWQPAYHASGEIPVGKFKAYYFNDKKPDKVLGSDIVADVAIKYSYNQFLGIASEDFGGYWIGYIDVTEEQTMVLNISLSWSNAKVFINKHQIFAGSSSERIPVRLQGGRYLVELQYLNHWHTTEFKAGLVPQVVFYTPLQLSQALAGSQVPGTGLLFAGAYESGNRDILLPLDIKEQRSPVVLFLSSYEAIKWQLNPSEYLKLVKGVVVSAYTPGSEVKFPEGFAAPVYHMDKQYGDYNVQPSCNCTGATWHCEGKSINQTIKVIEDITGLKVLGFSGAYSPASLSIPASTIDPITGALMADLDKKLEAKKKQCLDGTGSAVDKALKDVGGATRP